MGERWRQIGLFGLPKLAGASRCDKFRLLGTCSGQQFCLRAVVRVAEETRQQPKESLPIYGFKKHYATRDRLHIARQSFHYSMLYGKQCYMASSDVETAFDKMRRGVMSTAMQRARVAPNCGAVLLDSIRHMTATAQVPLHTDFGGAAAFPAASTAQQPTGHALFVGMRSLRLRHRPPSSIYAAVLCSLRFTAEHHRRHR